MMEKSQNKPAEGEAFTGYMEKPQQPATQTLRKSLFSRGKQPGQPIRRGTISGFSYNEELATKEAMMQLSITARGGPKISGAGLIESPAAIENREKQIDANNGGQGSPKNAEESDDSDDFQFEEPTAEVQFGSYLERINQDFDQRKIYEEVVLRILNFYQRSPQKHPAEAEELCRKYKKAEQDPRKRTLFLDMDDLLISVSLFQHPSRQGTILDINDHTGKTIKMYLYVRPGLLEFLEEISQHFELILYNNGSQPYTEAVLRKLLETLNFQAEGLDIEEEEDPIIDGTTPRERRPKRIPGQPPKHYFDHILSREQCSSNEKGHEIKNLSFLVGPEANRDIKDQPLDEWTFCTQLQLQRYSRRLASPALTLSRRSVYQASARVEYSP
ncbi:hypothetical protein FGO68_gene7645 [Halteria grandinella]|uniref:Mitochondrial import inner membrane translocase subunit TIM50 n=1 Tax=Halteria grandinella TaxID=5974 RepID=A0A8J8T4I5_HALGN|nr:hypothetical protein FGO68_gene7645 [Halteria grandinella]